MFKSYKKIFGLLMLAFMVTSSSLAQYQYQGTSYGNMPGSSTWNPLYTQKVPTPSVPGVWDSVSKTFADIFDSIGKVLQQDLRDKYQKALIEGTMTPAAVLFDITKRLASTSVEVAKIMSPIIIGLAAIGVTVYGAKRGIDVLKEYMILRMGNPQLIKEILKPRQIKRTLNDLHFTAATRQQLENLIAMTKAVKQTKSAKFENILLWGHPGTGKTAFVETLAKEANMTLFKTAGGDFAKLRGKDLQQIDQMLRKARKNWGPVILFIDEAEDLFGSRAHHNMSEDARNILSKMLVEFSEPSSQILLVCATNRPEDLDEAINRRLPQQVEIGLPDLEGRIKVLTIYKRILFVQDKNYNAQQQADIEVILTATMLKTIAQNIGTVSPSELYNMVITIKNQSLIYNNGIPTKELIERIVKEKRQQLDKQAQGFKRSSIPNN